MANPRPQPTNKPLSDNQSILVKRIIKAHPLQFVSAVVIGPRGAGKSMYCYKVMARVYQILFDLDEAESYKMALDHMMFSMPELGRLIAKNVRTRYSTPVICLDDASVHYFSQLYFTKQEQVTAIHGVFDTIRVACSGMLLNCPNEEALLSFIRNYNHYKIMIHKSDGHWGRYARAYKFNRLPDGKKKNITIPFQDNFSCHVPDEYFQWYMDKRYKILEESNKRMMKALARFEEE